MSRVLRALLGRAPVPVHMLEGGHPALDAAFLALLWLGHGLKLLLVPAVLLVCRDQLSWAAPALLVLIAGVLWLGTRQPRSCAAPMRDEALLLLGGGAIVAVARAAEHSAGALALTVALALTAAVVALAGMGAGLFLTWGRGGSFVEMRRPTFRILADNPDAIAMVARLRVTDRGVRLTIPKTADGPTGLAVNHPNMKVVAKVSWQQLQPVLAAADTATVFLGPADSPHAASADFHVVLPPGRYVASVRNYRPWHRDRPPTQEVPS
ncbi:MAG: hypothetical protein H6742_16280 [Alphaproteobacteria bacterium]|nr:hypothetical protein [Alphaproteobacteria bacterium]